MVAVTKQQPRELIHPLVELGALDLGENYPQELWAKVEALPDLAGRVRWHLIGHLQSNKSKRTIPLVRMMHGVDSLKLLRLLDEQAANLPDPPSVCLQVNTSGEASKHGWSADGVLPDAEAIAGCRSIPVVGLMTMAALEGTLDDARRSFATLRQIRDELATRIGRPLPELSMGMTHDFEVAIEEGATWVRVGTALFAGVAP